MDFDERVTKTTTEYLDALIKDDKEALDRYDVEFKKEPHIGFNVLISCVEEIRKHEDKYDIQEALMEELERKKTYYLISVHMNFHTIEDSDDPEQFKREQEALVRMLTGMRNIASTMFGRFIRLEHMQPSDEKINHYVSVVKRRCKRLRKNIMLLKTRIEHATTIAELNEHFHSFIQFYTDTHPHDFSGIVLPKK